MGVPHDLVLKLKRNFNISTFIESGTYQGQTALWAAQHFEKVYTIEKSIELYERVSAQYNNLHNVNFLFGDTRAVLKDIVPKQQCASIYWLDAHWSGGITYGEKDECPLIRELEIINANSNFTEQFILIDDARLFLKPPPPPHNGNEWPDINQVIKTLTFNKNRYTAINEDVIINVPLSAKSIVVEYCHSGINKECEKETEKVTQIQQYSQTSFDTDGKIKVIQNCITSKNIVFDIGANLGAWSIEVLKRHPRAKVHLFEPTPHTYMSMLKNLADHLKDSDLYPSNYAIADKEGIRKSNYYTDNSTLSTFFRRKSVENILKLEKPEILPVLTTSLDNYCRINQIQRINFLKIDMKGGELDVVLGAKELLNKGRIDYLQFEYGGAYLDANITLKQIHEYLRGFNYAIFKILPSNLEYRDKFIPEYEDYQYSNFLAVNERFHSLLFNKASAPKMHDIKELCSKYSIIPRGIIHIGAHEGKEIKSYSEMNLKKILFIEANPSVFEQLKSNTDNYPNVVVENCAISNKDGKTTLYITTMDQSSSILPLKNHLEVYPEIKEASKIVTPCKKLDTLLNELHLDPAEFNVLNNDIQGAELLAFEGANNCLRHVEAINTEVNYEEMYEGCALINDIDDYLEEFGFERVATTSPYHSSWGDGFYVKRSLITMRDRDRSHSLNL